MQWYNFKENNKQNSVIHCSIIYYITKIPAFHDDSCSLPSLSGTNAYKMTKANY